MTHNRPTNADFPPELEIFIDEPKKIEVISYSEISKFDICERAYYYAFDLGLRPVEEVEAIATGVKGHKLLQTFYNLLQTGKSKEDSLVAIQHRAKELIAGHTPIEVGSLLKAWNMVDNFIRQYDNKAKVSLVENRFLLPASMLTNSTKLSHIHIGFTPDVVFERNGGFMDVEDSKFIGKAWSKAESDHFTQAKLYHIFLKKMGYKVSRSGVRFFNTTTGRITDKFDPITPVEESILVREFVEGLHEIVEHRSKSDKDKALSRRTFNFRTCRFCSFSYPCKLEREGKDASNTLKYQFTKNDYDYTK